MQCSPHRPGSDLGASPRGLATRSYPTAGRYFCCVGGVGLDAEVARRANQLPRALRRRGGYLLSLLPALFGFQPVAVKVQAWRTIPRAGGTTRHEGPAMVVAFANTPTYGGGILIAPHARLDDGKFEICVVGAMAKSAPAAAFSVRLFRPPSAYSRGQVFPGRPFADRNRKTIGCLRRRRVRLLDSGRSNGGAGGAESDCAVALPCK